MRASRLLALQMLLETRGRLTARELADALEVSVRTVLRDVDHLSAAGVPVYADRGRDGGFRLIEGWRTSLTGLTPAESRAVFLAGLSGPANDLGIGHDVRSARLKMLTSLPSAWREESQRLSARLHLDPVSWYAATDPAPHLLAVADAVWHDHLIEISYESWRRSVRRTVAPLGLVLKAGLWYLVAARNGIPRTYRIANIGSVTPKEGAIHRPPNFDLAAYWQASVARFERELYASEAIVLATESGMKMLSGLSSAVARAVAAPRVAPVSRERLELRIPIESVAHATRQLFALAPDVEVIGPAALRTAIQERARGVARLYAGRRSRPAAPRNRRE